MKTKWNIVIMAVLIASHTQAENEAIHMNSSSIQSWASGVQSVSYGSDVAAEWKTPAKALGHAEGTSYDIVCLGRGGQITLTFPRGISNGDGNDFAIFENGISDTFLELGWVEVSTDGSHFVRMYNLSATLTPVGSFGEMDPALISGLASEYKQGTGTGFDLGQIQTVYDNRNVIPLSSSYKTQLENNFSHLNLNNIQYVRIVDIIGDGTALDATGSTIYDPYPTTGSAGFDLDAIAVLHEGTTTPPPPPSSFANWAFAQGLSGTPSADFDGDGSADLEEYFLGSSPTNLAEKASFSGRSYSNQFKIIYHRDPDALGNIDIATIADLAQTNWVVATPDFVTSNGTEITVSLPITSNQGFYRLRFKEAE